MTDAETHVRGCTGKKAFASMAEAKRRAKLMRQKYNEPLVAYRCPHCHMAHIGGADE